MTTLVRSLAAAGLLKPQRRRRVARRPARIAYELTAAGYAHVRQRVGADLVEARAGSKRFTLAVAYAGILPRAAAAATLRQRIAARRAELTALSHDHGLPEYQMLEVAYAQAVVVADIAWTDALIARLDAGTIAWPEHDAPASTGEA